MSTDSQPQGLVCRAKCEHRRWHRKSSLFSVQCHNGTEKNAGVFVKSKEGFPRERRKEGKKILFRVCFGLGVYSLTVLLAGTTFLFASAYPGFLIPF